VTERSITVNTGSLLLLNEEQVARFLDLTLKDFREKILRDLADSRRQLKQMEEDEEL
jgi:cell division septum initiation protein DivIVA